VKGINVARYFFLATVSLSALAVAACKTPYATSYTICNDVNVTNNDCPDNTANVVVENDIKGM
jgi:hypothetical protein